MDTQFIGEHLGPGKLGHFFVVFTFVTALFSCFSYWRAAQTENDIAGGSNTWLRLGRNGFVLHTASIVGIFGVLYYIISNHLFEYHYAWRHSDLSLPPKYLLSCFWEGQEGSFLLWTIWDAVLGMVVIFTAKKLESRVMTIIAMVQIALASMLLGLYFGQDVKIGSMPFILLRDVMSNAPIFSQPNYMSFIKDGNGLNVLLQNYWMVIHPPVLFLGFASTIVPFAYTIAALWKRDYQQWVRPALIWSLFSGAVLGTGIMMGGAWAYESLNFGGYWAWDPVENASLVPWLTLVAGLHTLIVYKSTGRSLIMTVILYIITYSLVWYSTFLTRTGILGDTSVHAFTDEGKSLTWHLVIVIGVLLILSIGMLMKRWKELPRVKTEESVNSREFWIFIGSFVLLLAAVQIIITTSIPVWAPLYKSITGKDIAPPTNIVQHYNSIQVWVASIITLLTATVLYLRFKTSDNKVVLKRLGITGVIALALALFIGITQKITSPQYILMLFGCSYTVVGMIYYAITVQKAKLKKLGASTSHLGFGVLLLGVLLSSYNKEVLSVNTAGFMMDFGKKTDAENAKESAENIIFYKNIPVAMGDYLVTYKGDSLSETDPRTFYKVHYERRDSAKHQIKESFNLYPDAFVNPKGMQSGLSANPASKHYLTKDIFTYVSAAVDPKKREDTAQFKSNIVKEGDTIYTNSGYMIFRGLNTQVNDPRYAQQPGDVAVNANLDLYDLDGLVTTLKPIYFIRDQYAYQVTDTAKSMDLYVRLENIIPDTKSVEIKVKQPDPKDDYIVMKALIFPYINLVWLGVIIMALGFLLSMTNRITKKEKAKFTGDYPFTK
ncbi:MAG: cytochrome c biogenesis protein CcsA [Bacteroidetes bacterium]|nr:cytochrome c biogenesis protein CcsA [Bacteroidota bacterium]